MTGPNPTDLKPTDPKPIDAGYQPATYHFRFFDFVMAAFVTILVLSNVIGAAKPTFITLGGE